MKQNLLTALRDIVGDTGLLTGSDVSQRQDGLLNGQSCQAKAVVRPADSEELSAVLKLCHQHQQPVTTQGGLTGLVAGAFTKADEIVVSLERMRKVIELDRVNRTLTVEAGVTLQAVQEAAEAADLFYPVDLGARGSATIGGTIATNAGGNRVLRYGMTRASVLGLEAVLADGTCISSLNKVIKNNTGYDLPQLFIGSEGTLGVVSKAVLRLRPKPSAEATALVAVQDFSQLSKLLNLAESGLGGGLSSFEVMWNSFYRLVTSGDRHTAPMNDEYPFYVIIETQGSNHEQEQQRLESLLEAALEAELISDAILTRSEAEREKIWAIRDDVEALLNLSPVHGFDISLPIPEMEAYLNQLQQALSQHWPDHHQVVFGHLGDGNLHLIIGKVPYAEKATLDELVYAPLAGIGGSVSAEHCIGYDKKPYLKYSRSEAEIELMKTLKRALDPANILNPGRVFDL
ncbi:FAD-binding oxidoreductase [Neptuniibacter halophilus]|uniref:FAD-binding oxidoreductase n=1 Tax=Neptuniibacter halophilus TaxID=651666 RepID=UPI002573917E|nr:FAD-binding oxidoreductase [Neptuniibacter halophilus]